MREITSLDELKSIELDIMKKIHTFCVENNIQYYLAYGTLIGAIRHKGFIPWDDDIDIWMVRPEYEKFMATFGEYARQHDLCIASNRTKPYMCRAFAKICDTRTIQYEPKYIDKDPRGVFVDIWPLDGYPNNKIHRMLHQKKLLAEFGMLYASLTKLEYIPEEQKKKRTLIKLFQHFDSGIILKEYEKTSRKYKYEDSDYLFSGRPVCFFKKEWFSKQILWNFEDTQFFVPNGYDDLLRSVYGDYMKLPPVEQQKPHHVIDTYWKEDTDESIG